MYFGMFRPQRARRTGVILSLVPAEPEIRVVYVEDDEHGGTIGATSQTGVGTQMRVTIPSAERSGL